MLKDIYKRFPFEDILNTITQEMTFNEFEAVVFYMFMKKVGWFSHFKMLQFAPYFNSILNNPPQFPDQETQNYYKDQVIHLLFIAYYTK